MFKKPIGYVLMYLVGLAIGIGATYSAQVLRKAFVPPNNTINVSVKEHLTESGIPCVIAVHGDDLAMVCDWERQEESEEQ